MKNNLYKLIAKTPIVKIKNINNNDVFVKLEFLNIGGSVKARVAYQMIYDISKKIQLNGKTVLEASGGNTAIGLAILSKYYGYKLICVIPDNYPKEKINHLKLFDVEVILSDHTVGLDSHVKKAKEIYKNNPDYIYTDQLSNYSNIKAHYFGTAGEIIENFEKVDYFLTGIGSGGTITGVGKRLKEEYGTKIIGILPKGYDIDKKSSFRHKIPGIGIGIKSKILDESYIDDYIYIDEKEIKDAFDFAKNEGLFLGISALANISAVTKLSNMVNSKTIVTIAQDSANSYLDYLGEIHA